MFVPSNPSQMGALTELAVATALNHSGLAVYVPFFSAHARVDLTYLNAEGLPRRVQCKTGHLSDSYISFWTCSHTGGSRQSYLGEVDEFGVFCPEMGSVYVVPIEDVPARQARLRVSSPMSNQVKGIRWAERYFVGQVWPPTV